MGGSEVTPSRSETWAPSGAEAAEEAEILHMDMRSVSLGMGKGVFYGHQKMPTAHGPPKLGIRAAQQRTIIA